MKFWLALVLAGPLAGTAAHAAGDTTPRALLQGWQAESGGPRFSAERGREFFARTNVDWSCSTCHTTNPRDEGRHVVTGRPIRPLAPAANADRFTDSRKVAKWFRRNCADVLGRECTASEKGDVLTWLLTLK